MTEPAPVIAVHPLAPARRDDFLRFFDHERGAAFADNPEWARCYCHFYHVPKAIDWRAFSAEANRTAMQARIDVGEMEGFLAYADDEVVGWLNAQPVLKLPHCWERLGIERPMLPGTPDAVAAAVCFVIAPAWRRRGVARALLEAAIASFKARGLVRLYAFPFDAEGDERPTAHYHGPARLFAALGFEPVARTPDLTIVALNLVPA